MVRSACFVPGCTTGYDSDRKICKMEGRKVKSLFQPPKDSMTFAKWKNLIPRADLELSETSKVCELHFIPEDIDKFYSIRLPNGDIEEHERGWPKLKPGSVPCIFPNLPGYLANFRSKRKLSLEQKAVEGLKTQKRNEKDLEIDNSVPEINHNDLSPKLHSKFSYEYLVGTIDNIICPYQWTVSPTDEFIICANWSKDVLPEKRIVIEKDLSVKVFLKFSLMRSNEFETISCLNDVSTLLEAVDHLHLCEGIGSNERCNLYLPKKSSLRGQHSNFCEACRKLKKKLAAAKRRYNKKNENARHKELIPALCFSTFHV